MWPQYHVYREKQLNQHQIPHPAAAIAGVVLSVFGMVAGLTKMVAPLAVISIDSAYQVMGFLAAAFMTSWNLYYWRQFRAAQNAKAIADLQIQASANREEIRELKTVIADAKSHD